MLVLTGPIVDQLLLSKPTRHHCKPNPSIGMDRASTSTVVTKCGSKYRLCVFFFRLRPASWIRIIRSTLRGRGLFDTWVATCRCHREKRRTTHSGTVTHTHTCKRRCTDINKMSNENIRSLDEQHLRQTYFITNGNKYLNGELYSPTGFYREIVKLQLK